MEGGGSSGLCYPNSQAPRTSSEWKHSYLLSVSLGQLGKQFPRYGPEGMRARRRSSRSCVLSSLYASVRGIHLSRQSVVCGRGGDVMASPV